ncbi:alpha-beta hydrolase family transporter esterase [Legionella geestiana]|uniref:Alpha-beta hydrolase family transporter esterase n=2 Tax=Legionella geestiana TaxID=45065 RepID=A0A0W0TLJ5_9GAMM|nr:alpha-beta hydrolase family transporter esterase [Legionella geestiana]STX55033.1 patatin family protein [Legionella geestiana]
MDFMAKKALYLAGGGARGAYQAGVLKGIAEILKTPALPFDTISGVSVGSINASVLAEYADDFPTAIDKLETLWREIHCHKVFNASNFELGKSVVRNVAMWPGRSGQAGFLLDTEPLHQFVDDNIQFSRIDTNIASNHLEALEIITTCYELQKTISFYQNRNPHFEDWDYPRHASRRANICGDHILASTALPLFFPTIKIGNLHYGDGGLSLVSPLRGPIRFEVNKVLVIGTRQPPGSQHIDVEHLGEIAFAQVLGHMLNGIFIDNLDRDIEMVNRMNDIARLLSLWKKRHSPWRPIETLYLRPSVSMAGIAQAQYHTMPALLRMLLNVMGAKSQSGDLLSFLLFEGAFTSELLTLGYQDTLRSSSEIEQFFA